MAKYQKGANQGGRGHPDSLADIIDSRINSASWKVPNDKVKSAPATLRRPVSFNRTHVVTDTTFSTQEKYFTRLSSSQMKLNRKPPPPHLEKTPIMPLVFKPGKSENVSTRSSLSSRGPPSASAFSYKGRGFNRRQVTPSHRQIAHDSPATATPSSRNKPLPPKPVLRAENSPEHRGIFDATDSASTSLNDLFPPLEPESSPVSGNISQAPTTNDSFKMTPFVLSTLSQSDTEIDFARVVHLQVVRDPRATRTSIMREQMHKNSPVLPTRIINMPGKSTPTLRHSQGRVVSPSHSHVPCQSERLLTDDCVGPNFSWKSLTPCRELDVSASSSVSIIDTRPRSKVPPRSASLQVAQRSTGATCGVAISRITPYRVQSLTSSPCIVNDQSVFNVLPQTHLDTNKDSTANGPSNVLQNSAKNDSETNDAQNSSDNSKNGSQISASKSSSTIKVKGSGSLALKRSSVTFGNVSKGFKSIGKKVTTKFNACNVPLQIEDARVTPETVDPHKGDRSSDIAEDEKAVRAARNQPDFRGAESGNMDNNPCPMVLSDYGIDDRTRAEVEEFNRFLRYFTDVYGALVRSIQQIRDPQRRHAVMSEVQRAGRDLQLSREAHIESLQINQELMSIQARLARNMTRLARLASESDK